MPKTKVAYPGTMAREIFLSKRINDKLQSKHRMKILHCSQLHMANRYYPGSLLRLPIWEAERLHD